MNTGPSWSREETLTTLPLRKPLSVKVVADVGGVSIFGLGTMHGFCGAGATYEEALSVFVDGMIRDYYEYWLVPRPSLSTLQRTQGKHVHDLLWPKGKHDSDSL